MTLVAYIVDQNAELEFKLCTRDFNLQAKEFSRCVAKLSRDAEEALLGKQAYQLGESVKKLRHVTQVQQGIAINWQRVTQLLDLRKENTLGTWFSSIIFFFTGMGFFLLGWGQSLYFAPTSVQRLTLQLAAWGCWFLSADEVGSFHETLGGWFERSITLLLPLPPGTGFSWVLLLGPIAVIILLVTIHFLYKSITHIPIHLSIGKLTRVSLFTALVFLPGTLFFELWQGYLQYTFGLEEMYSIFPCIEESLEILGMYSLFICTVGVAKQYQL